MRKFEDLVIGEKATSTELTVDFDEMVAFARQYDPQWFHADPEAAKNSSFGEVIASGIYTAALWRRLDHEINGNVDFICGVAWENARWPKAVRPGDTLRATSEVLEKRESGSDPSRGVAVFLYGLVNQHDECVFSCRSINLVRRR
ncbi:MaoC family dehydratase [Hyphococcus sp.]|uniref:MaoC family dehydratase n=1 Tax=Hyphococcus sp. TaxID=2038636 RepID=UPI003CCBFA72